MLAVGLAACGGSGAGHTTSVPAKTSRTATSAASGGASVTTGPVRATLTATSHNPVANRNWSYMVTVTDAHGHPLAGTTLTEFTFGGAVVGKESPATHTLKGGRLKDHFKFPARSIGYPISLAVVVHTKAGSVTLRWPVTVGR